MSEENKENLKKPGKFAEPATRGSRCGPALYKSRQSGYNNNDLLCIKRSAPGQVRQR